MDSNCTSSIEILPDSRLREPKGIVRGTVNKFGSLNWAPVFCANCGVPYGYVPEESCTFAFWLCTPCSEKYGAQAGLAMMPDEVFWGKVKQAQLEEYGRILSPAELQLVAESSCTPLAKLLREK